METILDSFTSTFVCMIQAKKYQLFYSSALTFKQKCQGVILLDKLEKALGQYQKWEKSPYDADPEVEKKIKEWFMEQFLKFSES